MRRPRVKQLMLALGLCCCALVVGCQIFDRFSKSPRPDTGRQASPDPATANPFLPQTKSSAIVTLGAVDVVELTFHIMRVEMPVESVRHSQKIWNHVDELAIDEKLLTNLTRNGVRIGACEPQAWPAIRTIIQASGAQLTQQQAPGQRGLPLTLDIGPIQGDESIFEYDKRGSLSGRTFHGGRKLLVVDYSYRPELSGACDIRVSLEVRRDRGYVTWERTAGGIRQVPAYERHVFGDMVVDVLVPPGGFLVVGPGDEATNEFLVGGKFFSFSSGGGKREIVYIITPRPVPSNRKRLP